MADFLLLLGKVNVAMAAAILVIYLLRRPLRALFGASIAYPIWLLVPVAVLASLLPPRTVIVAPTHPALMQFTAAPISVAAQPTMRIAEKLGMQGAPIHPGHPMIVHPVIAVQTAAVHFASPDYAMLLFVAWVLGAILMAAYLARLQARFLAEVRSGEAGPAVLGIFRPRITIPESFEEQFTAPEQAAILAHERVHLARQDARVNALAALLRCLCWFNPLVHLGTASLRIDQELACDAAAVEGSVSRRDYANALVKSQIVMTELPLGCNWPGSQHPLIERIALLKRRRPGAARRITGTSLVILAATSTGLGAWAAQPPVAVQPPVAPKSIAAAQIASAKSPMTIVAPIQDGANEPVGDAKPMDGDAAPLPLHLSSQPAVEPPSARLVASIDPPAQGTQAPAQPQENIPVAAAAASSDQSGASTEESTMVKQALAASAALLALNSPVAAQPARTCALPSLVDSAPLQQLPGSNLMTVPVQINGQPKQFLLDIGTSPTGISQAAVTQLGLPEADRRTETITGQALAMPQGDLGALTNGSLGAVSVYDVRDRAGIAATQTRVRINSFTIGNATGKHLMFLVANDAEMGQSPSEPYDGLLTGDFFRQYDVELDFGGKQINYLTPTKCTDPDQVAFWPHFAVAAIPMTIIDGKIRVPVLIQGHSIDAVIDTSSSRTLMRRDIAELALGLKADTADMAPDGGLTDRKGMPVYAHTFPQISFTGGVTATNVPALILTNGLTHEINRQMVLGSWARSADAEVPDLVIGMDVLHQLHMYVVPGQGTLYVTSAR